MLVIFSGIVISVRPEQSANAFSAMAVTFSVLGMMLVLIPKINSFLEEEITQFPSA